LKVSLRDGRVAETYRFSPGISRIIPATSRRHTFMKSVSWTRKKKSSSPRVRALSGVPLAWRGHGRSGAVPRAPADFSP